MVPSGTHCRLVILTAGAAEFEHQPEHLGVDEGIVFAHRGDLLITLGFIGIFAETDLPLRAVHVEAEEVRRRIDIGGFLRARRGVDERQFRVRLGEVLDRNTFVARQRRKQYLHLVLLDQLANGAHREVGGRVGGGDDEFELLVAYLGAEFIQSGLKAAYAVLAEHRVGALQGRRHTNLDLLLSESGARHKQARQRSEPHTALQHRNPPVSVSSTFIDVHGAEIVTTRSDLCRRFRRKRIVRASAGARMQGYFTASLILCAAMQRKAVGSLRPPWRGHSGRGGAIALTMTRGSAG